MDETNPILENEVKGQGVFVGSFDHSLDPKKRLTIPSEWRAQVDSPKSLYVLPDIHYKCLCVYPSGEMMRRLANIRKHTFSDRKARDFARVLASQSDIVSWDSQGRIRVKDALLEYAGLVNEVELVGAFSGFELWNPDELKRAGRIDGDALRQAADYVGF